MEQDILQRSDFFETKHVKNVLESMCLGPCKLYSCNAGDQSSVLESGRSPGGEHGNPLQYSCLENSTDRRAWWLHLWGCEESDKTEQLTYYSTNGLDKTSSTILSTKVSCCLN